MMELGNGVHQDSKRKKLTLRTCKRNLPLLLLNMLVKAVFVRNSLGSGKVRGQKKWKNGAGAW